MIVFIVTVLLGLIAVLLVSAQKTYIAMPEKELRRRVRDGDELAAALYRAAAYGVSLRVLMWSLIFTSWSLYFIYVAHNWPDFIAFVLCVSLLIGGFSYTPSYAINTLGGRIARLLSPAVAWILNYVHPIIDWAVSIVRRHRPVRVHTGLYERQDLVELLERQQVQTDNRIDEVELNIALHALTFGQLQIGQVMTPRRMVKMVQVDDTVGPLLMTELHDSGHSRFPVYDGEKENIVGTLYLRELTNVKSGGLVRDVMRAGDVCYVHEDQSLADALQAVYKTRRHLMIVVNSFEEFVGIITAEDVLEQIVGRPIMDEFDQYEDIRAVAARIAQTERDARNNPDLGGQSVTEVIE